MTLKNQIKNYKMIRRETIKVIKDLDEVINALEVLQRLRSKR